MVEYKKRVNFWNSYINEANRFAKLLRDDAPIQNEIELEGETLSSEKHHSVMTISLLALVFEARTNHLLHRLKEEGDITEVERNKLKWKNIEEQWVIIPQIKIGKNLIDYDNWPHKSIPMIRSLRNTFFHAKFEIDTMIEDIPTKKDTIELYNFSIIAMKKMNELLGFTGENGDEIIRKLQV